MYIYAETLYSLFPNTNTRLVISAIFVDTKCNFVKTCDIAHRNVSLLRWRKLVECK
jgi:hypothetical protein